MISDVSLRPFEIATPSGMVVDKTKESEHNFDVWQQSHALDDCQNEQPKDQASCYCCGAAIAGAAYQEWCQGDGGPLLCDRSDCPARRPPKESP